MDVKRMRIPLLWNTVRVRQERVEWVECQKEENSIALEHSKRQCLPEVLVLMWGVQNMHLEENGVLESILYYIKLVS